MGIIDTLKYHWRTGSLLLRIIFVNVGVFLFLTLLSIAAALLNSTVALLLLSQLQLPSDIIAVATHPWTIITYMFVHSNLWHLAFNMLWLYWFGTIFLSFNSERSLAIVYVYGGLAGALMFVLGYLLLPGLSGTSTVLTGASAAVIAVVTATTVRYRDYPLNLFLFGSVALKWVGLITIGFCFIQSSLAVVPAHLGGLLAGLSCGLSGDVDFKTRAFACKMKNRWASLKSRRRSAATTAADDGVPYDRVDEIITKVKKSGYASLTDEEKRYLFMSNKR